VLGAGTYSLKLRDSFEKLDELYAMKVPPRLFKKVVSELAKRNNAVELVDPVDSVPAKETGIPVEHV